MNEFSCIIDNKNNKSLETFGYEANTVHLSCDDDFDIGESMELSRKDKVKPLKRVSVPNVPQSGFIKATVSIQSKGDQAAFSPGKQLAEDIIERINQIEKTQETLLHSDLPHTPPTPSPTQSTIQHISDITRSDPPTSIQELEKVSTHFKHRSTSSTPHPPTPNPPATHPPQPTQHIFPNGKFQGTLSSTSQKTGHGIFTYNNGDIYTGNFSHDCKSGHGTYQFFNKDLYIGQFSQDIKSGFGKYFYRSGSQYIGYWSKDRRHGDGVFYFVSGSRYEGEFFEGRREGQGRYLFGGGGSYVGGFVGN